MSHIKYIVAFVIIGFCFKIADAQIKISEIVQESKVANADSNKLYVVDFWATWCGPCIHAKKLLTVLQQQFPTELYIVSLSEENPIRVKRFLESKPTELAVVMDFYGQTFDEYKIKEIPKGILFNAKGEQLWKGHPSDLKPELIKHFLKQVQSTTSLSDFLDIIHTNTETNHEYIPVKPLEIKETKDDVDVLAVNDYDTHLKLRGSLKSIISYLSRIYTGQIHVPSEMDINYEVYLKKPFKIEDNLGYKIIERLGYSVDIADSTGEVFLLTLNNPQFWDTYQIDWGQNASKYLISDTELMADNVSLKDVAYKLSNTLNVPVMISNEDDRSLALHDWQIHYKFFEFMKGNFEDYGVNVEKKQSRYIIYSIMKKAP